MSRELESAGSEFIDLYEEEVYELARRVDQTVITYLSAGDPSVLNNFKGFVQDLLLEVLSSSDYEKLLQTKADKSKTFQQWMQFFQSNLSQANVGFGRVLLAGLLSLHYEVGEPKGPTPDEVKERQKQAQAEVLAAVKRLT
jgi:hypothetical protein